MPFSGIFQWIQKCFAVTLTYLHTNKFCSGMWKFIKWRNMCGKLASYGRYHDNRTPPPPPPAEKLPKYNIVKINSFISICYELKYLIHLEFSFKTFRGTKKRGSNVIFFILKLIKGHEPDMVYHRPVVCFCRPCFS